MGTNPSPLYKMRQLVDDDDDDGVVDAVMTLVTYWSSSQY